MDYCYFSLCKPLLCNRAYMLKIEYLVFNSCTQMFGGSLSLKYLQHMCSHSAKQWLDHFQGLLTAPRFH